MFEAGRKGKRRSQKILATEAQRTRSQEEERNWVLIKGAGWAFFSRQNGLAGFCFKIYPVLGMAYDDQKGEIGAGNEIHSRRAD